MQNLFKENCKTFLKDKNNLTKGKIEDKEKILISNK